MKSPRHTKRADRAAWIAATKWYDELLNRPGGFEGEAFVAARTGVLEASRVYLFGRRRFVRSVAARNPTFDKRKVAA